MNYLLNGKEIAGYSEALAFGGKIGKSFFFNYDYAGFLFFFI